MCKRGDSTQCSDDMLHDPAGKGVLCWTFPDFVRTSRGSPRRCCVSGGRSRACVIVSGSSSSARKRADAYARVYVRFGNGLHQSSSSKLSRITSAITSSRRKIFHCQNAHLRDWGASLGSSRSFSSGNQNNRSTLYTRLLAGACDHASSSVSSMKFSVW